MNSFSTERVRALVHELIHAGCDMVAVGAGYVLNEPEGEIGRQRVNEILSAFGDRRHLIGEISGYLRSLGRMVEL